MNVPLDGNDAGSQDDMTQDEKSNGPTADRIRAYLCGTAGRAEPVTYQALAKALDLSPPNTIHQVSVALEQLIQEDVAADRPLIAALVISKARGGLPAPGFFDCAERLGRFHGADMGAFYSAEFEAATAYWGAAGAEI